MLAQVVVKLANCYVKKHIPGDYTEWISLKFGTVVFIIKNSSNGRVDFLFNELIYNGFTNDFKIIESEKDIVTQNEVENNRRIEEARREQKIKEAFDRLG